MEAKDLMIGDWVQVTDASTLQKTPCQITIIREKHVGLEGDIDAQSLPVDLLEPIPLTPEILEKNGFVFAGDGQRCMMFLSKPQFAEGLRFNIYVGLKRKTIEVFAAHPIERSPNWRKSNKVYLEVCGCYVHELQHALRLCGIEKEIEL